MKKAVLFHNLKNVIFTKLRVFRSFFLFFIFCSVLIALFTTRTRVFAEEIQYDWFWMFYEYDKNYRYQTTVYRPLFMRNIRNSDNNIFEASLMPIVYWKYKTSTKTEFKLLFGFIDSLDYTHPGGIRDYDFGFFPFLLFGDSEAAIDRYFHIWPLGGTIRGKLGQDRISAYIYPGIILFFLFPSAFIFPPTLATTAIIVASLMPLYVDYNYKDYKSWAIFWPIIQRGKSRVRDDIRVMPFYSHNYIENRSESYSIMLIFNYQKKRIIDDEEMTFFAFPFYGKRWKRSSESNSSTLLWPFFSWGYDIKTGGFELNFPWPLVQIQTCRNPHIKKEIFFPFLGKYEYKNRETFFITPLYFSLKSRSKSFNSEYYINAVIIWYFKREYLKEPSQIYGRSWRYFKIWPLFHYEKDDRGNSSFNLLSLLPMRDPEGYERLYQPFWTILEYSRFQSGEKRLGILCRIYYQRWSKDYLYIKMPFIFSYGISQGKLSKLSFLFSIFSYKNDITGRSLRLFWIPLNIWSDNPNDITEAKIRLESEIDGEIESGAKNMAWAQYKAIDLRVREDILLYSERVF